jgi:hypothetical protein
MQAPVELMFRVLVSSMNSTPVASVPRKKTGIWMRIRGLSRCWEEGTDF